MEKNILVEVKEIAELLITEDEIKVEAEAEAELPEHVPRKSVIKHRVDHPHHPQEAEEVDQGHLALFLTQEQ